MLIQNGYLQMKFPLPKEPPSAPGRFKSCLPVPEVHIWSCSWQEGTSHILQQQVLYFLVKLL